MTYKELYESATRKLEKNEINLGEYEEMTKPLNEDIRTWIPVSERLPKELDGTVLITVNGEVRTGQYSEFSNTWYKGDMGGVGGNDPIAWMPLPKPYEKQESETES